MSKRPLRVKIIIFLYVLFAISYSISCLTNVIIYTFYNDIGVLIFFTNFMIFLVITSIYFIATEVLKK